MKYFELLNEAFTKRLGQSGINEIDTTDFEFGIEPFYSAGKMIGVKLIITKHGHKYKLAKLIEKNDEEKHPFDYKEKWIVEYDIAGNLFSAVLPETYGKGDTIWTPFHLREEEVADVLHLDMNKFKKMFSMVGPKRDAKEIKDTKLIPTEKLMEDDGDEFDNIQVSDEPAEVKTSNVDISTFLQELADIMGDCVVDKNVLYQLHEDFGIGVYDETGNRIRKRIDKGIFLMYSFWPDKVIIHNVNPDTCTEIDSIGRKPFEYFSAHKDNITDFEEFMEWCNAFWGRHWFSEDRKERFRDELAYIFKDNHKGLKEDDSGDEFDNIQVSDEPVELDVVDTKKFFHNFATKFASTFFNDFVIVDNVIFHIRKDINIVDDRPNSRYGDKLHLNRGIYLLYVFEKDSIIICGPRASHAAELDKIGKEPNEYFFGVRRDDQTTHRFTEFSTLGSFHNFISDTGLLDKELPGDFNNLVSEWAPSAQLLESVSAGDIKLRKFLFAKTPRDNKKFPNQAGYYNRELQGYLIVWDYNYNIHTGQSEDLALSHKEMRKKLPYDLQEILIDGHGSSWGREDYYKAHIGFFVSDGMDPKDEAILRRIMSHEDKQKD